MYILITYYNRGTESNPHWEVYGVKGESVNECLGTFSTEEEAKGIAEGYNLPVMRGSTNSYGVVRMIESLTA